MAYQLDSEWPQKLERFGKVLSILDDACARDTLTGLELAGLMRAFKLAPALGCHALRALLTHEDHDVRGERDTIRTGFQEHFLNERDAETLLELHDKIEGMENLIDKKALQKTAADIRQSPLLPLLRRLHAALVDHTERNAAGMDTPRHRDQPKNTVLKDRHRQAIIDVLAADDQVERVVLFGSRATATNTPASSVDVALFGAGLTPDDRTHFARVLDRLTVPHKVNMALHVRIRNAEMLEHIRTEGIEWYRRPHHADAEQSAAGCEPVARQS